MPLTPRIIRRARPIERIRPPRSHGLDYLTNQYQWPFEQRDLRQPAVYSGGGPLQTFEMLPVGCRDLRKRKSDRAEPRRSEQPAQLETGHEAFFFVRHATLPLYIGRHPAPR